ncbi:hypothetical protein SNEBB_000554 [Seison nebaliae]|nr:hypothetical protein SNEBB_000554 [Seison nebaliae]
MLNKQIFVIFFALIVDLVSFTIILPLLPKIFLHFKKREDPTYLQIERYLSNLLRYFIEENEIEKRTYILIGGILASLFSLLKWLNSPMFGKASDIYGRRRLLILCAIGAIISNIFWHLSINSFFLFILCRMVGGSFRNTLTIAVAMGTDLTDTKDRSKVMALFGIAFSFGFIIGPLLSVCIPAVDSSNNFDWNHHSKISIILSIFHLLILLLFVKESKSKKSVKDESMSNVQTKRQNKIQIGNVENAYFYFLLLFSGIENTITYVTQSRFNYTSSQQGKLLLFTGFLMILCQGTFIRRISSQQLLSTCFITIILTSISYFTLAISYNEFWFYVNLIPFSMGATTIVPLLTSYVSNITDMEERGFILGRLRSQGSLARAIGPFLVSLIYWLLNLEWCYSIISLISIITSIVTMKRLEDNKMKKMI